METETSPNPSQETLTESPTFRNSAGVAAPASNTIPFLSSIPSRLKILVASKNEFQGFPRMAFVEPALPLHLLKRI